MARGTPTTIDQGALAALATRYTAAWNSGSPEVVAGCDAPDCGIVIDRGQPWTGRPGVAAMAAVFYADVPDLALTCDGADYARQTGAGAADGATA